MTHSDSGLFSSLRQQKLLPPATLTLSITGTCNLICHHCWVDAGVSASSAHIPTATLRRLIEESSAMGITGICLTGGEPLCHPDWLELLQFSRMLGFRNVALQTNAMLLTANDAAALRSLDFPGLSIRISLDGATAATHDLVRGEGAFAGAVEGIAKLVQEGLAGRIGIGFTEMHHNLEEFPALLELAEKSGISSVAGGTLVVCGRAEDTAVAAPEVGQYQHLIDRYDNDLHFRELYERVGTMAALEWYRGDSPRSTCCTFVENPYLTASGLLYPCVMCHADHYAVSGVFEKGLAVAFAEGIPLWSELHQVSEHRAEEISECRECPARLDCAGGCMGRAWGSCGDFHAADDRCRLRRSLSEHGQS